MDSSLSRELASESSSEGGSASVALGNTWSHCVNTRLIVQYVTEDTRQVFVFFFIFSRALDYLLHIVSVSRICVMEVFCLCLSVCLSDCFVKKKIFWMHFIRT